MPYTELMARLPGGARGWGLFCVLATAVAPGGCDGGGGKAGNDTCTFASDCQADPKAPQDPNVKCCSGVCRDITSDHDNCGGCGQACASDTTCESGKCGCSPSQETGCACSLSQQTGCGPGQVCCAVPNEEGDGTVPACVTFDSQNCGACGKACPGGGACCAGGECVNEHAYNCGACGVACSGSDECCNGACADTITDCGKCGHACDPGEFCQHTEDGSSCVPVVTDGGTDAPDPCENVTCTGKTCCSLGGIADCVDLNTDKLNCGECNDVCGPGEVCVAKVCLPADAAAPDAACLLPGTFCGQAENACCGGVCGNYGETLNLCCSPSQTACTPNGNSAGSCCQYQATSVGGTPVGTGLSCMSADGGAGTCCVQSASGMGPVCLTKADCCDSYLNCTQTNFNGPQCCQGGNQPCRSNADCCGSGPGSSIGNCNPNPAGTGNICCAKQGQPCDGKGTPAASTCCGSLTCQFVGSVYLCE